MQIFERAAGLFQARKCFVCRRQPADETLPRAAIRENRADHTPAGHDPLHAAGEGVDLDSSNRIAVASGALDPSRRPIRAADDFSKRILGRGIGRDFAEDEEMQRRGGKFAQLNGEPPAQIVNFFAGLWPEGQGLNVANGMRDVEARYRAEVAMMRDDNTGQSERPVMMARKNFRLLVEGESQEGISVMQVANIRKTPAGVFQTGPAFRRSHAGPQRQRLPALYRAPPGGDSVRQEQHARRFAAPEEPEPGGFHRLRYRQFLAALHHQHRASRFSATCLKRAADIPRRCTPPCCSWPDR